MDKIRRVILMAFIGEQVVKSMEKADEKTVKVRDALDFCWEWIETGHADEGRIYEFLDDEDEDDLAGYCIYADNAVEKKKFSIILGVFSYIAYSILSANKSPVPQFLELTDDNYYALTISDAMQADIDGCTEESIKKVSQYYDDKVSGNDLVFTKEEILNL